MWSVCDIIWLSSVILDCEVWSCLTVLECVLSHVEVVESCSVMWGLMLSVSVCRSVESSCLRSWVGVVAIGCLADVRVGLVNLLLNLVCVVT